MLYLYLVFAVLTTYSVVYDSWTVTVFFALMGFMCLAFWWHKEMQS